MDLSRLLPLMQGMQQGGGRAEAVSKISILLTYGLILCYNFFLFPFGGIRNTDTKKLHPILQPSCSPLCTTIIFSYGSTLFSFFMYTL